MNFWRRSWSNCPAGWLSIASAVLLSAPCAGQTVARSPASYAPGVPMVSGFERFARHGEISDQVAGSLLISELSCVSCHASSAERLAPKRGPRLGGAGNRLQPAWVRSYLSDPQQLNSATTMPDVLGSLPAGQRAEAIDALAAFLGAQLQPFAEIKAGGALPVVHEFWKRGDPRRGSRLYHSIGCVACHEPDADYETSQSKPSAIDQLIDQLDPEELAELGLASAARRVASVPHGELVKKYSLRSLTMMLLDPAKTRPSARMPALRLAPAQAADIAAYLVGRDESHQSDLLLPNVPAQLMAKGRALFVQLRCVNCHDATGVKQQRSASRLSELDADSPHSCIENPTDEMASYRLDELQRKVIRTRLKNAVPPSTADDEVSFRMLQLNCYGCHQRDQFGGIGRYRKAYFETVGQADLGDEGRLPPTLSGVGRKLLPKALAAAFHPKTPPHRPFMTIRMPSYATEAVESLIAGFPEADQVDKSNEEQVFAKLPTAVEAGRELINTGCVQCHPFRGESLPGVVGVDLAGITGRVYPQWFKEFVFNPSAIKQRTRMPTFFPNGKSNRDDVLEGNVHRQLSSLWTYLKRLEQEPLPAAIAAARSANYELSPEEKPIVLRTFMDAAGTHAIAVGFPQGAHYAFDAQQVRIAIAWKGRFLDARGTWFERFTPPADPLGERQVNFPSGQLFRAEKRRDYQFGGYRIDAAGVPTLLYRYGDWSIEDRIEATRQSGLKRTLKISATTPSDDVTLRPHAGGQLVAAGRSAYTDDQGLTIRVPEEISPRGTLHQFDQEQEWLIPLAVRDRMTIVLEYSW